MEKLILFVFLLGTSIWIACKGIDYRRDEVVYVPSEDTTIMVKISYPEKWTKKDKVLVWSLSPVSFHFISDSVENKRNVWIGPELRSRLLAEGYVNVEYLPRDDSVFYQNRKYCFTDAKTKAADLDNLLLYIQKTKPFKGKKAILIGHSEGGDVNSIVASGRKDKLLLAIVQLASGTISGKEHVTYQREKTACDRMVRFTLFGNQGYMDTIVNKISSLDSYITTDIDGMNLFFKENIEPLESIYYQHEKMDSIYYYIDLYLKGRWMKEDENTKAFHKNDFENYHKCFSPGITPQQITLLKYDGEDYYPSIHCPVLSVHGTDDERIECYSNVEKMKRLLEKGGNLNFESMILDAYNHHLAKGDGKGGYIVEDHVIDQIVAWINKQ